MNKTHIIITVLAASLSFYANAKDWSFELEPYLMVTSIEGDASIGRVSGTPIDVDFSTILDNLDMAAMLHFEAHHKSGWGLAMDYSFMDLSQKKSSSLDGFLNVGIRQGVLETLGLYRIKYNSGTTIDYFAGIRWWDNDLELTLDPAITTGSQNIKVKEDWIDVVAGMRIKTKIAKNWHVMARADIGGFGLSADFTSTVEAGATYRISKLMTLDMKYKASWIDYDNEKNVGGVDNYQYDTVTHGPVLGLVFNF